VDEYLSLSKARRIAFRHHKPGFIFPFQTIQNKKSTREKRPSQFKRKTKLKGYEQCKARFLLDNLCLKRPSMKVK